MSDQKPSVGRIVHYVSYGTPGGEYTSQCRAAIVTEVPNVDQASTDELRAEGEALQARGTVGLVVLNPSGMLFNEADYHDGSETPGVAGCPDAVAHGNPFRYCACGWTEAAHKGGTWHWPERV
jgi:hypothetical protein